MYWFGVYWGLEGIGDVGVEGSHFSDMSLGFVSLCKSCKVSGCGVNTLQNRRISSSATNSTKMLSAVSKPHFRKAACRVYLNRCKLVFLDMLFESPWFVLATNHRLPQFAGQPLDR